MQNGEIKLVHGRHGGEHKDYHGWEAQERYEARLKRKAQNRARLTEALNEAADFMEAPWNTKPVEKMRQADGKKQLFWHLDDVLGDVQEVKQAPSNVVEFDTKKRGRHGRLHVTVKTDSTGHLTYASVG